VRTSPAIKQIKPLGQQLKRRRHQFLRFFAQLAIKLRMAMRKAPILSPVSQAARFWSVLQGTSCVRFRL
jgi:hypothetical protein